MTHVNDGTRDGADAAIAEPSSGGTKLVAGVCLFVLAFGACLLFDLARWVGYPWFLAWMPAAMMVGGAIVGNGFLTHPSRDVRRAAGRIYWVAAAMFVISYATIMIREWSAGRLVVSLVCAVAAPLLAAMTYWLLTTLPEPPTPSDQPDP